MIGDLMEFILILIIWFVCGFVAFLIEVKRKDGYYMNFNDAEDVFVVIMIFGILSLVTQIILLLGEAFHDGMDKLIDKINKM